MPTKKIADVALYYEMDGVGPATVAFLNGIAMTVKSWQPIREHLVAGGFRCLLHDFRGQLCSDKPTDSPYSLDLHAADFLGLLDALSLESVHLVGTSYGAEIGMIFAYSYPERVRTLTLIAAASELDGLLRAAAKSWQAAADCGAVPFFRCMAPWAYCSQYLTQNQQLLQAQEEATTRFAPDFFVAFKELVRAFLQLDITVELERIACPTLVICADQDLLKGPRFSRLIHDRIANSELVVIPGAAHAVVLEQPERVADRAIEFIDRHLDKGASAPKLTASAGGGSKS
jgi:3-oxoadipate enol-lactonase